MWIHAARWLGTDLAETRWFDVEVIASTLAGVAMFDAELHRVTFFGCKLDSLNLRTAALRDVAFVDCVLPEVDFGEAMMTGVSFPGPTLDGVRFGKARMNGVDFRDAAELAIADGIGDLRGSTINSAQLLDLGPQFAEAIGVEVRDR